MTETKQRIAGAFTGIAIVAAIGAVAWFLW